MQDIRWDDLKVLLAIARSGSLQGAAAALGVNASTAWRRLNALEEQLGAALFDRDARGYGPTPLGEAALEHATRLEEEVLALTRTVTGHDREAAGPVRLTLPESLLELLAEHLLAFADAHPRIRLDLLLTDRIADLSRREADVAVRPSPHPPEEAVGRRIATLGWAAYGPVACEADAVPWLAYGAALVHLGAARWQAASVPDAPLLTVDSVPAMHRLLASGCGRGLLPCYVGDAEPRLRRHGDPIPEAASALWLLLHADLRRTARVRALVDFLVPRLVGDRARLEGVTGS